MDSSFSYFGSGKGFTRLIQTQKESGKAKSGYKIFQGVEVKFEDPKQGQIQVVDSPLIRLTTKPNATIEDIGSPEKLIASLGSFVSGNMLDTDEVLEASVEKHNNQTYYTNVLNTPLALTGAHNLAKATTKGNTVILFVASANDKQWQTSQKILKVILEVL